MQEPSTPTAARFRKTPSPYTRTVERLVIHGAPIPFRTLCERAVPTDTRFLLLDLDRTLHLGRNMGELLGWELGAYLAYGPEHLSRLAARRRPGRWVLDPRQPLKTLRYVAVGLRMWALPGLFYLVWGKLALLTRFTALHRLRRFGTEPVRAVQAIPQHALLHHMSRVPLPVLRRLARDVWRRHRGDQVIERDDLEWLRARCPGITIILTSASPRPMLEVAAEELGVDHVEYSETDAADDRLSAPARLLRWFQGKQGPARVAAPSRVRINASHAKIERLLERYPDLSAPEVVSVGMTDTGYGEDHCWAEHLSHVVDVNSTAPFAPIVSTTSPLREVHSAQVLTHHERLQRAAGHPEYVDPKRPPQDPRGGPRVFEGASLASVVAEMREAAEELTGRLAAHRLSVEGLRARGTAELAALHTKLERIAETYNAAHGAARTAALRELEKLVRAAEAMERELARLDRPVAEVALALGRLREASRRAFEQVTAESRSAHA